MTISKASGDFTQSTQDKTLLVFLKENKHWIGRMTLIPLSVLAISEMKEKLNLLDLYRMSIFIMALS